MSAILQVIPEDLNPVDLGEVFECEESVKDCLIVASTAQPTIGRKVLLVLFGKHNSLIAGADIQLEWSIGAPVKRVKRVRHSAIFNHAFAFVPGEAGLLEITVTARNPVTGETRTLNVVLYVRRPYPLFEYLKKLTKVHDQWALRNARTLINFSRSIIGVGDPIHIQRPEDISPDEIRKNSGLLARNLFLLDPSNISFDGDRKMTEHLISQYAAHFDAANLSSISDDKRPPKELLIGIVSVSLRQSGEIEKESIRELRMIDGLMFKYHGSILSIHHGPLLHRLAAVSLVAGPKGLSAPTAALISGNLILAEHSLLNEPSSITSRRMIELLSSFPKSAVRVAYALIKQIKSELHPSKTTAQLLGDEPAMREIATEYFRLMLGPELRVDEHAFDHIPNIPATGYNLYWSVKQFAEEAIKLSQAPETMVIARGGLEARNVSTRVDQNGKVTQSLDYAHPYKAEFPWALRPISALYDEHDQSTLSKTLSWSGEHFGWDISADVNEDAKNAIISDVETWQMVLLDVGFWGDYDRNNPQRNFGMIEGRHIWLCSLIYKNSEVKEVHGETLARFRKVYSAARLSAPSLVERILKAVAEWGYTIEIISYTYAPTPPVPQTHPDVNTFLPEGKLKLIFPDMHLPEQWPDIPTEGSRIQDEQIRRSLTRLLKTVQTSGGVHRESVHNYLAALAAHQLDNQNPLPGSFSVPGYGPVVDPIQFDAEYRFVERKIRLDASWFYPPRAVKPKIHDSIEELFADPSPAIDLAALLTAVIDLNCADIDMVQVGNLYEMWMGHEWLYTDVPPLDDIK